MMARLLSLRGYNNIIRLDVLATLLQPVAAFL
jgi:hypothetical protein